MKDVEAAVIAAAEGHVRACQLADLWPRPDDCLPCYLHRALVGAECDGKLSLTHEWQGHQRARGRRTGGLTAWLKTRGGYCDCEVLINVYPGPATRPDPWARPVLAFGVAVSLPDCLLHATLATWRYETG